MSEAFTVRIEWVPAPGVSTPELAATWARYEIWVAGRCVTQVEESDGTLRRSVYGSLYPLAEWVAANWWALGNGIRPSAVESRYWTWSGARVQPWLAQHNLRGAGDGMAWPDLTLVPEGSATRLVWVPDRGRGLSPVHFVSAGQAWIPSADAAEGLASLVDHVLDRLVEAGLRQTRLAEEWAAVAEADDEESEFCRAVARLGLDPYAVDEETAADVLHVAGSLPAELVGDFFDNADPKALRHAASWALRAVDRAATAAAKAPNPLGPLYEATAMHSSAAEAAVAVTERPWTTGYRMARQVRDSLAVPSTERFDVSAWLGKGSSGPDSGGIPAVTAVSAGRCGLVQGRVRTKFGQAKALGRVLTRPQQHVFLLSAARGYDERVAGAFAAELLAPADGIRQTLASLGGTPDDAALDEVARQFDVSALVIRHQYDNQLAGIDDGAAFASWPP